MLFGQFFHHPVAKNFCDDTRRRDGKGARITLDDGACRDQETRRTVPVHERGLGRMRQAFHRTAHGKHRGLEDIDIVNLCDAGLGNRDRNGAVMDLVKKRLALLLAQLLAVVEPLGHPIGVKDNRRGNHRPGKRAAPDFIHPAYRRVPLAREHGLEPPVRAGCHVNAIKFK